MAQQRPGFDQHVIGCDQRLARGQNRLGARVAGLAGVRRCIPDGSIDKNTHGREVERRRLLEGLEAKASATIASLLFAISEPPDVPRSNTSFGSAATDVLPRSRS